MPIFETATHEQLVVDITGLSTAGFEEFKTVFDDIADYEILDPSDYPTTMFIITHVGPSFDWSPFRQLKEELYAKGFAVEPVDSPTGECLVVYMTVTGR